jgi:hypothetical protein
MIGPRVIRFGVVPTGVPVLVDGKPKIDGAGRTIYSRRTRIEEITKREKDVQLALAAKTLRILPPVPGKRYVGIEIPNPYPTWVGLADVLSAPAYRTAVEASRLVFALGRDVAGQVRFCDIAKAPHLLIAGATGTGKSMLLNVLIASLLTQATPDEVRLRMIDPKKVELTPYNGIAHLLAPVVTEAEAAVDLLDEAVSEMQRRYTIFARYGVRNLDGYRRMREAKLASDEPSLENLPAVVIIIDELADLMIAANDDVEKHICRLAQLARATGIHLVIATQRPSVDVITGLIKANIPTRIALTVAANQDSRTILDRSGAEKLMGKGDLLYLPSDEAEPIRIQGAFMTDRDAGSLAAYWRSPGHGSNTYPEGERDVQRFTTPYWKDLPEEDLTARLAKPVVSDETINHIEQMKAKGFQDQEIASLVGLSFSRYQQVITSLVQTDSLRPSDSTFPQTDPTERNARANPASNFDDFATETSEACDETSNAASATHAQNTALNRPQETTQTRNRPVKQYRLSAKQIAMFCALYPIHIANKDDALTEIGANSSYRAHANEIIEQYRLLEKKRGKEK